MTKLELANLLYRRSETVRYSEKSIKFLDQYAAMSHAGMGVEVDGDALANVRAAS